MSDEKQSIRARARNFRRKIDVHPDMAESAAQNFIDTFLNEDVNAVIAVYMRAGSELDCYPLVEQLWACGVTTLLPCIGNDRVLSFREWTKQTQLVQNKFDIAEPNAQSPMLNPTHIIVPLLAFDQQGYRLGQGGGYYDATIAAIRAQNTPCKFIGYAYAAQAVLLALPREDHDQKLDYVVTEQRVFSF